jgi:hypothetical protein
VSMDTAVAIRTLEATYKSSADSVAVESLVAKLMEKVPVAKHTRKGNELSHSFILHIVHNCFRPWSVKMM